MKQVSTTEINKKLNDCININFILQLLIIFILSTNFISAQDYQGNNLKNLKNVVVSVQIFRNDNTILDSRTLQTKIELKLRLAKIKVIDKNSVEFKEWETPNLKLMIFDDKNNYLENPDRMFYTPFILLSLHEYLELPRAKINNFYCGTWQKVNSGIYDEKDFVDGINEIIDELLDEFINNYLKDNP